MPTANTANTIRNLPKDVSKNFISPGLGDVGIDAAAEGGHAP
jgi:hypothetical protein